MPIVDLTRTVRCVVDPRETPARLLEQLAERPANSFAAFPSSDSASARFFELRVRCRGPIDPATGYFLNIKDFDSAFRSFLIPELARLADEPTTSRPQHVVPRLLAMLNRALSGHCRSLTWNVTPFLAVEAELKDAPPNSAPRVTIRQRFDFSAAHRLHAASLSDDENRRVFGKCNNPRGHGHNYGLEPCVELDPQPAATGFTLADLERLTAETIIDRFDHKHLNDETAEFDQSRGGVNPSVENIAVVCYNLLAPKIAALAAAGKHARLRSVTVWETPKTSATYPAE
ncbi:MAG: 6-carboxytetrahydropterin synthase [Phycisphaeraceae bacterium]|nr:6-carboxytetrahydropterin synthase [Phycisphaeraceae bacterium]